MQQELEDIIRLNNKGVSLLPGTASSKGGEEGHSHSHHGSSSSSSNLEALKCFHIALHAVVELQSRCAQSHRSTTSTASACAPQDGDFQDDVLDNLSALWHLAPAAANSSSTSAEEDTYHVFSHAFVLQPEAVLERMKATTTSSTRGRASRRRQECHQNQRILLRLVETILLMNAALACYQAEVRGTPTCVCHGCLSPTTSARQNHKQGAYHCKALALYARAVQYLNQICNMSRKRVRKTNHKTKVSSSSSSKTLASSLPPVVVPGPLAFLTVATLNNASWIYLQLGQVEQAKRTQTELYRWQQHPERLAAILSLESTSSPREARFVQEFYLNATMLTVTGYFSGVPAPAA
mgnify:CR=1 FL=1